MSQVLRYGFPTESRLLCENPICEASATTIAQLAQHPVGSDTSKPLPEICGCDEHIKQLTIGRQIAKLTHLKVAGQRNAS